MAKVKLANVTNAVGKGIATGGEYAAKMAKTTTEKAKELVSTSQQAVTDVLDQDGSGTIDSTDLIIMALKVPGIKVKRDDFIRREFFKMYPADIIETAIAATPAYAGIASADIDRVANEVIKRERNAVSGISVALGMPGGVAMVATIPADIAQYYGYMLRAAQQIMYLYGFPELDISQKDRMLDSETINCLTICLGIMYGVASANNAIKALAKGLAKGVEKKLLQAALTKGSIYPIVKSVAKWFGVRMTKEVFAGFFKKAIPVVGGIIGGGLSYLTFKPCCYRLKVALSDTMLSNPNHISDAEENKIYQEITGEAQETDSTTPLLP